MEALQSGGADVERLRWGVAFRVAGFAVGALVAVGAAVGALAGVDVGVALGLVAA